MSYSIRNNTFVSHLQSGRGYKFHDSDSKRAAFAQLLVDDQQVRDAAQKRAQDAGINMPLSDREIAAGNFMPDRRTTAERVADQVASRGPQAVRHDPYQTGIDAVRAGQRLTDSQAKREGDEATIQRLEEKSAEWQQLKAATAPAADPNAPADSAAALRKAAEELRPDSILAEDQARHQRAVESLLTRADAEDVKAIAESERAAKAKTNEPWVVDADATLFLISKDPSIPQVTVNAVRDFRQRLANLEATGEEWIAFANSVDAERKQIRAAKIAEKNAEIAKLEADKTAIRNDDPPAEAPANPPGA